MARVTVLPVQPVAPATHSYGHNSRSFLTVSVKSGMVKGGSLTPSLPRFSSSKST
jgi:hypothetical protein